MDEIINSAAVDGLNFYISIINIMKNNEQLVAGKDYQYNQNLVTTKTIDIVSDIVEKKYQLKKYFN